MRSSKCLYPGMKFKRWFVLFALGVMTTSIGFTLIFNYKYLDLIEENIFKAVYYWRGSYDYTITTMAGLIITALGVALMLIATR